MSISVACPHCGARLKAPENLAGQMAKCPQCAAAIPVPADSDPPPNPFSSAGPAPPSSLRDDLPPASARPLDVGLDPPLEVAEDALSTGGPGFIPSSKDERSMAMLCHLLAVFTGFIGPLILWLVKKDESRFVDYHGKESLNFSLNILVYALIATFLVVIVSIVTCGFGVFLLPIAIAPGIYGTVMHTIACIKANNGELYRYPATVRVIT